MKYGSRGSYVHNSTVGFLGASQFFFFCNFLRKLMVSDNKIHRAFRTHTVQLYKQKRLEKCLIFTIYQNYTLALMPFLLSADELWVAHGLAVTGSTWRLLEGCQVVVDPITALKVWGSHVPLVFRENVLVQLLWDCFTWSMWPQA